MRNALVSLEDKVARSAKLITASGHVGPSTTTYFVDELCGISRGTFWYFACKAILSIPGRLNRATASHGAQREALSDACEVPISLTPINEQKRIADKLDALLARVDACRERLDRVPAILKRFRQAVLAAATSGKLTEDWREEQQSQRVADPASGRYRGNWPRQVEAPAPQ